MTRTFVLTVRAPALIARFTVSSASRGTTPAKSSTPAGASIAGSMPRASGGFVSRYTWLLTVGTHESSFPTVTSPSTPHPPTVPTLSGGTVDSNGAIGVLNVTLMVEDRDGNTQHQRHQGVNLYTRGFCGY